MIATIKSNLQHYAQLEVKYREVEQNLNEMQKYGFLRKRSHIYDLARENAELKRQIAFANEPRQQSPLQRPISQQYQRGTFVPASHLPDLPEEAEVPNGYGGRNGYGAQGHDSVEAGQPLNITKRMRMETPQLNRQR